VLGNRARGLEPSWRSQRLQSGARTAGLAQENDVGERRLEPGAAMFVVIGSTMSYRSASPFTQHERDLIRLELMPRFGQEPDLANGLFLRTWRAGPQKGQPKIPKAIQTMLDRGLVRIGKNPMGRATALLEGLRRLLQDRRAASAKRRASRLVHVLRRAGAGERCRLLECDAPRERVGMPMSQPPSQPFTMVDKRNTQRPILSRQATDFTVAVLDYDKHHHVGTAISLHEFLT